MKNLKFKLKIKVKNLPVFNSLKFFFLGQRIKVIKELESMNLSNAAREAFQTGIEDTLITLNDQEKSNNNANVRIEFYFIQMKKE